MVIGLAKERFTKNLWTDRGGSGKPHLVTVKDQADQARYVAEFILECRETGNVAEVAGSFVPRLQP